MRLTATKLTLSVVGVVLIALVVPAMASATVLREVREGGEGSVSEPPVATGNYLVMTSGNMTVREAAFGLGEVGCREFSLPAELTMNNSEVVGAIGAGRVSGECQVRGGGSIPMTDLVVTSFRFEEGTHGTVGLEFDWDLPGELVCHFHGTVPAAYTEGYDILSVSGHGLAGTPEICGEEGEVSYEAEFSVRLRDASDPLAFWPS
jgi:hypothetical protein